MTQVTLTLAAADRDGIAQAQTTAGAGNLTLNGALSGTMDQPRHVSVYSAGNVSGVVFTVTGTDRFGTAITEAITGPNATTVKGAKNFKTVTQVAVDGAVGTNTEVGSANEAETAWVAQDLRKGKAGVQVVISTGASLTYALQHTVETVQSTGFQESDATAFADANITGETTSQIGSNDIPVTASRIAITGHSVGGITADIVQRAP